MKKTIPAVLALALVVAMPAVAAEPDVLIEGEVTALELRLREPSDTLRAVLYVRPADSRSPSLPVECGGTTALRCAVLEVGAEVQVLVRIARDGLSSVRLLVLEVEPR